MLSLCLSIPALVFLSSRPRVCYDRCVLTIREEYNTSTFSVFFFPRFLSPFTCWWLPYLASRIDFLYLSSRLLHSFIVLREWVEEQRLSSLPLHYPALLLFFELLECVVLHIHFTQHCTLSLPFFRNALHFVLFKNASLVIIFKLHHPLFVCVCVFFLTSVPLQSRTLHSPNFFLLQYITYTFFFLFLFLSTSVYGFIPPILQCTRLRSSLLTMHHFLVPFLYT